MDVAKKFTDYITYLVVLIVVIVLALFVSKFSIRRLHEDIKSMEPAVKAHSFFILRRHERFLDSLDQGDVVAFHLEPDSKEYYLGRIIAKPGESIAIKDGKVSIDGSVISESYYVNETPGNILEMKVPLNHVFILPDNRSYDKRTALGKRKSPDSRYIGPIPAHLITGKINP